MNIYTFSHVFYMYFMDSPIQKYGQFIQNLLLGLKMRRYSVRALNGLVKESPMQGGCQLSCTFRRRSSSPVTKALSPGNHTLRYVDYKFRESVQIPVVLPSIGRTNNLIRPSQIGPHRPSTKLPSASKDDKLWIPTSSRSGQVYKYSSSGSETL